MSDLTIADFWGINDVAPDMNDGMGTSLVLIRKMCIRDSHKQTTWMEIRKTIMHT